jgi:hypothetical protein
MKTTFFTLAITGCLFLAPITQAEDDFAQHKTEALSEIDERIQKLQEHRNCVNNASAREALMECRKAMKAYHESQRAEHLEKRRGRLEQKLEKLKSK